MSPESLRSCLPHDWFAHVRSTFQSIADRPEQKELVNLSFNLRSMVVLVVRNVKRPHVFVFVHFCSLEELQVIDIKFLYNCSKPTICLLYQDPKGSWQLVVVVTNNATFINVTCIHMKSILRRKSSSMAHGCSPMLNRKNGNKLVLQWF